MAGTGTEPSGFAAPVPPAPVPQAPVESDDAVALRRLVGAYGRLSSLATDRTDLADVTRLLADTVGSGVAVLGPTMGAMAVAGVAGTPDEVVERLRLHAGPRGLGPILAAVDRSRRVLTLPGVVEPFAPAVVAPIITGEDLTAYLVTFPADGGGLTDDTRLLLTEHAAMICGVVLGRERVVAAAAGRARRDLVEGVLHGTEKVDGELARWAGHLGFVEGRAHHVLSARAHRDTPPNGSDPARIEAVHATIETYLTHRAPRAVVAVRDDEVVAIVPTPDGEGLGRIRDLAHACRAAAERRHPGFVTEIGIGGQCECSARIAVSYGQARRSLDTIRRTRRGGVVAFGELGIQRLLLQVPDVAELRAFAHEVLAGALDQGAGTEHLRTLAVYFRENCSPRRAAVGLHVHPNTVSYRVRRIEELTGLSLDYYQDRLLAQVAVEILVPSGEP